MQFVLAQVVVGDIALAKQQPVALLAVGNTRLEQAAQARQAGAVAQQNQRHRRVGQMEAAVAPQAQADGRAEGGVFSQPAGAKPQAAVGVALLAHDQLQHTVAGNRGDGVFAHAQRYQRVHQCLGVQADQVRAVVRQLARGQGLVEGVGDAVDYHAVAADQAQAGQEVFDSPRAIARQDFHQVAGQPAVRRRGCEAQQVDGRADTVGVEQGALAQGPVFVLGRRPGRCRRMPGELAQLLLPGLQRQGVAAVDFHRGKQGVAALVGQPEMQAPSKAAKMLVLPVTQGQHRVVQAFEGQRLAEHAALETTGAVGGFAVAKGTDHKQCVLRVAEVVRADTAQGLHLYRQARSLQLPGRLPGQLFGKTALAGEADQPGRRIAVVTCQTFAGIADLALFAASVEVQQPARDEEQRHEQGADGEDNPPDQTEIAAGVQRIHTGQQLRLEAFAGVALVGFDLAGGRV